MAQRQIKKYWKIVIILVALFLTSVVIGIAYVYVYIWGPIRGSPIGESLIFTGICITAIGLLSVFISTNESFKLRAGDD